MILLKPQCTTLNFSNQNKNAANFKKKKLKRLFNTKLSPSTTEFILFQVSSGPFRSIQGAAVTGKKMFCLRTYSLLRHSSPDHDVSARPSDACPPTFSLSQGVDRSANELF
jgi:hypothetical protein